MEKALQEIFTQQYLCEYCGYGDMLFFPETIEEEQTNQNSL